MSEHLKVASKRDVKEVFDELKGLSSVYKHHRRGFSNDKGKTLRHVTTIPMWVLFDPLHKDYFDPRMDQHERSKNLDAWIKKNDWFDFRKHG